MAAAVLSVSKPSYVKGEWKVGNRSQKIRDITVDTGNYATGGFTVTAASFGLKVIEALIVCSTTGTNGTAGATANDVGVIYASDGTSVTIQLYESGASGAAQGEKTNAEAVAANFTIRTIAVGR